MSAARPDASVASATGAQGLLERSNLSARQLLIYTGQRLHPDELLYDAVYCIEWPALDPQRFEAAWRRLIEGCDALRTVVEESAGIPQQRVLLAAHSPLERIDLQGAPDVPGALEAWIGTRVRRSIVLHERLYDAALLRTGAEQWVWFLNLHHVIADAAAAEILIEELYRLYRAPDARCQLPAFAEHIAAERAQRQGPAYQLAQQYWQQQLQQGVGAPQLYGVQPKSRQQTRLILSLAAAASAQLSALARSLHDPQTSPHAANANVFTALLAMYLRRIGAGSRLGIGATYHNRRSQQDRRTVGLFMEILPLIVELSPQDSLTEVVRQVRERAEQAVRHRGYSVANPSQAPAYVALLNYMRPQQTPTHPLRVRRIHPGLGAHALSLSILPPSAASADGFELWLDIHADILGAIGAARAAGHCLSLMRHALAEPQRSLGSLALMSAEELQSLRAISSGPPLAFASAGGCLAAFESQVRRTPEATALSYDGGSMRYGELERHASQLAQRLRALGARQGRFVAIHLERSAELLIALLATLKCGAAYVPVDPAYPAARQREMLHDAAPLVIVTCTANVASLPAHAAYVVSMDEFDFDDAHSPALIGGDIGADDIAYLMYTSGSSGTPKGVLVTHGGVCNYLAWRQSYFPLTAEDRCLHKASLNFDDSVWEILEPLSIGACIVLARARSEYDSAYLVKLMASERVSAACFVPSLLRALSAEPGATACHALRRLTTGGEVLSPRLAQRVRECFPAARLYNGYGTTETTIASSFWRCVDEPHSSSLPIGRPIANTEIHLLDAGLEAVPMGVPAEICIGGAGLAHGYFNRAALSAERFIEHPLAGSAGYGQRLYRTGDLGRWRGDGELEFLGRIDDQIKLRGVRIELGDVEAALLDHPGVSACAVVCHETPAARQRLVAYVVPCPARSPSTSELRAVLRDRLPVAMIPSRFEMLPALPNTPSGKLDRRTLKQMAELIEDESRSVAPRSAEEAQLLVLWEQALEARPIGVQDDFFALGGDSLTALRLIGMINQALACTMSPEVLFEAPSIEMLAQWIGAHELHGTAVADEQAALVPLDSQGPGTALYLVHQIDGELGRYRELARLLHGQRAVYGLRAAALPSAAAPLDRIVQMAHRYVELVRAQQPHGPYALAGHSAGGLIALEMARELRAAGEEVVLLAMFDVDANMRRRRGILDALRFHLNVLGSLPRSQRGAYVWRNLPRFVRSMHQRIERPALMPQEEVGERRSAVRDAMERAVRDYRPAPYGGSMVVFRALDRSITGTYSRALGWQSLVRGTLRVIDIPGNHLTLLRSGPAAELALQLNACLPPADPSVHA